MDFFGHQDRARASTRKLILLFCCAVAALILAATVLVYGVLLYTGSVQPGDPDTSVLLSDVFLKVSLGVVAVVFLGSLFRLGQLRGGGKVVAESLNGRLINLSTRDPDERKVLNVVEEMAIASGIPVPPVYLIEDPAINAFAAGYQQEDAVIGVTRGCIAQLDRDELQGVIAHEFSHIFHGDMRINIRLIGVLYGIMVIGLIGYYLMRGSVYAGHGRRGRNAGGLVMAGLGLVVIGYGGTFFGNLIKAAVSRQREFLADASAVQFTRNPQGIAGALRKIGGLEAGSRITSANVAEYSHMLFEEGRNAAFLGLFATHPPLEERIRRIDPAWKPEAAGSDGGRKAGAPGNGAQAGFQGEQVSALASIGNPSPAHIALAHSQLGELPEILQAQAHSSLGACFLIHALLLGEGETARRQLGLLEGSHNAAQLRELQALHATVKTLPRELRLPLLDLALPGLRALSDAQCRDFIANVSRLIAADRKLSLFEWCLFKILRHYLVKEEGRPRGAVDIRVLRGECAVLLKVLAQAGHATREGRAAAFHQAWRFLTEVNEMKEPGVDAEEPLNLVQLDGALERLRLLKPLQKPRLLKAMAACIDADGRVAPAEAELLRAVSLLLDCPVPPLLSGQKFF